MCFFGEVAVWDCVEDVGYVDGVVHGVFFMSQGGALGWWIVGRCPTLGYVALSGLGGRLVGARCGHFVVNGTDCKSAPAGVSAPTYYIGTGHRPAPAGPKS